MLPLLFSLGLCVEVEVPEVGVPVAGPCVGAVRGRHLPGVPPAGDAAGLGPVAVEVDHACMQFRSRLLNSI